MTNLLLLVGTHFRDDAALICYVDPVLSSNSLRLMIQTTVLDRFLNMLHLQNDASLKQISGQKEDLLNPFQI